MDANGDEEEEEEEEYAAGYPSPPSVLTQMYHRHRTALSKTRRPRGGYGDGAEREGEEEEEETPRAWRWGEEDAEREGERMVEKARGIAERLERLDPHASGTGLAQEAAAVAALRRRESEMEDALARDLEERVQGLVAEHAERVALCEETEAELVQGLERIKGMLGKVREERRVLDDAYETCLSEVKAEFADAMQQGKRALLDEERDRHMHWSLSGR